jgi:prepilin-type N-terminal cleavage/methylation domain-containing protein
MQRPNQMVQQRGLWDKNSNAAQGRRPTDYKIAKIYRTIFCSVSHFRYSKQERERVLMKSQSNFSNQKGFTLFELFLAMVLIGVLAAMIVI